MGESPFVADRLGFQSAAWHSCGDETIGKMLQGKTKNIFRYSQDRCTCFAEGSMRNRTVARGEVASMVANRLWLERVPDRACG